MKLRDLFDKLLPGSLSTLVTVKVQSALRPETESVIRTLKAVVINDDGSVTLVVEE